MDRDEEKQARCVIADVLYSPDKKHLTQVVRTEMIVDYMNVIVKKYKIIEKSSEIQSERRRNMDDLASGVRGICSGSWCCCCCTTCYSVVYNICKLTLLFMLVFFVFGGVVAVLWYGWQFFSLGWRSFLPSAWGSTNGSAAGPSTHNHL